MTLVEDFLMRRLKKLCVKTNREVHFKDKSIIVDFNGRFEREIIHSNGILSFEGAMTYLIETI